MKGIGKKGFTKNMANLRRLHNFEILSIFEPRISGLKAQRIIKNLGFDKIFVVDVDGFSGGIWLLWNDNRVKIYVVAKFRQCITSLVKDQNPHW